MKLSASWSISGVVVERREVKSEKNKEWRGYFCKVATKGLVAEVEFDPKLFERVKEGEPIAITGTFKDRQGVIKFIADGIIDHKTGEVRP